MATPETARYYPLSALPLDKRGAVLIEAIDHMVLSGQAEQAALSGLGWVVKCGDTRHRHTGGDGVTLVGEDRQVKIGAACTSSTTSVDIPAQPRSYDQDSASTPYSGRKN